MTCQTIFIEPLLNVSIWLQLNQSNQSKKKKQKKISSSHIRDVNTLKNMCRQTRIFVLKARNDKRKKQKSREQNTLCHIYIIVDAAAPAAACSCSCCCCYQYHQDCHRYMQFISYVDLIFMVCWSILSPLQFTISRR